MGYQINKGVGAPLDFFGLKSQYIVYFAIGVVLAFLMFFIFQFWSKILALFIAVAVGVLFYFGCKWANKKFGRHGVSIAMTKKLLPNRVPMKRAREIVKFTKH